VEEEHEQRETRQHRQTVLLRLFVVVSLLVFFWSCVYLFLLLFTRQMTDKGVHKKGDKFVRKPPRQRGNTEIMPFKAPRTVTTDKDSNNNSEVHAIAETENARDLEARKDNDVFVNPYPIQVSRINTRQSSRLNFRRNDIKGTDSSAKDSRAKKIQGMSVYP
jgi:hypothetical protein